MENELLKNNIKRICREKGITVRQLELQLGLASGTLSRINSTSPSINRVASIAKALGVTIDELVYGDKKANDEQMPISEEKRALVDKIIKKTKNDSLIWKILDVKSYDNDANIIRDNICNYEIYSDNEVYFASVGENYFVFQIEYNDYFDPASSELRLFTLASNDTKPVILVSLIPYLMPLYKLISEKVINDTRRKTSGNIVDDFMNDD